MLALGTIPAIVSVAKKPPVKTSITYGIVLGLFGVVYCSFGTYFAAATVWMQAFLWFILAGQVIWNERIKDGMWF